jgi:hypothetical protein
VKTERIPFSLDMCGKSEIYEKENNMDTDLRSDTDRRVECNCKRMESGRKRGF